MDLPKHNHGRMYRAKIVPFSGPTEFGPWFSTESEVRTDMDTQRRNIGSKYYCETKTISCPECEADDKARVVGML